MTEGSDSARPAGAELVVSRVFSAPRGLVFRMFAEAERLARWWGPRGYSMDVVRFEFRPGGTCHFRLAGADGHEMWARFHYREIVEPARLVFVSTFSDPAGGLTRAPFGPDFETFPLQVLYTVTLEEQGGRTSVMLHGTPIEATAAERAMYEQLLDSMRQGFGASLEQLEALLASEGAGG